MALNYWTQVDIELSKSHHSCYHYPIDSQCHSKAVLVDRDLYL